MEFGPKTSKSVSGTDLADTIQVDEILITGRNWHKIIILYDFRQFSAD